MRRRPCGAGATRAAGVLWLLTSLVQAQWSLPAQHHALFTDSSDIAELAPTDIKPTVLASNVSWIVAYYADWCSHCIVYAPVYKRIAAEFKGDSRVRFGALDCAIHSEECIRMGVSGYPTVKAYHFPGVTGSNTEEGFEVPKLTVHSEYDFPAWIRAAQGTGAPLPPAGAFHDDDGGARRPKLRSKPPPATVAAAAVPTRPPVPLLEQAPLRLVDAEVALLFSLRQGAFLRGQASGDSVVLSGEPLQELCVFLEFVAVMLPSRRASQDVGVLASVARMAEQSPGGSLHLEAWTDALDGQGVDSVPPQAGRDPTSYWRLCTTYTCGLWQLFHILTLSSSQAGDLPGRLTLDLVEDIRELRVESSNPIPRKLATAKDTLFRIRGFVANFFGCQECTDHFLKTFDACTFGRCDLGEKDGKGASLWLSRVHNAVTRRVAGERGVAVPEAWPPRAECAGCWPVGCGDDSCWNPKEVYGYLLTSHWQQDWVPGGQAMARLSQGRASVFRHRAWPS